MVWIVFLIKSRENSRKCNGVGCWLLSKVRKSKKITVSFFRSSKVRKLQEISWCCLVFVIRSQESHRNIMFLVASSHQTLGITRKYNGLGSFLLSKVRNSKETKWLWLFWFITGCWPIESHCLSKEMDAYIYIYIYVYIGPEPRHGLRLQEARGHP